MDFVIRKATENDAYGVEYVAAHSFKETYTGFMPESYLNNRINTIENKVARAKEFIKNKENYYVATVDDKIVGICYYGKSQNEKYNNFGLVEALYVLNDYQKLGIGKKLFNIAIQGLIDMGYNDMYLECLKGNPTIDFYKHFGGQVIETIDYPIRDFSVKADIMVFNDLKNILNLFNDNKLKKL